MSDEVSVDDSGLTLPIDVNAPVEEPETREIKPEDLRALAEVEAELDQRWSEVKIDPTLTRMELLMDLLGNPERSFPAIHVAGTNGKTSTVRMIEALMRAFHRRTGRTTSPHLQLDTERIAIDGQPLHPRDYVRTWREIQPYVEMADAESEKEGGPKLSKFEVLTAMSYAAFADAPVDVAVVEVGMGGLWDATNVINADVAVITPIGLDHTDYLGSTVEEVAREKAGIIKPRWDLDDLLTPPDNVAIVADQDPAAMTVILEQAVRADAAVARAGSEFGVVSSTIAVGGQQLTLQGLGGDYTDIFLPLSGEHQANNAAVALAAVEAFFGAGSVKDSPPWNPRAGSNVSAPRPPCLSTPRTTPTVPAHSGAPCNGTSPSTGSSAWSGCSPTKTTLGCSPNWSLCLVRLCAPKHAPRVHWTPMNWQNTREKSSARSASTLPILCLLRWNWRWNWLKKARWSPATAW